MKNIKYLNNIGKIDLNSSIDTIYSTDGKFLISPTAGNNHFFEMSGEVMYNALLLDEKNNNNNRSEEKRKIIQALKNRRDICDGFFYHKSFNNDLDTQLRSTSAVIRTFVFGYYDGYVQKEEILDIVNKHFKYHFKWGDGVWFCHDTSEFLKIKTKGHMRLNCNEKNLYNTVTLNTHFDSLTTLSIIINQKLSGNSKFYEELYSKGIKSINKILDFKNKRTLMNALLQRIHDSLLKNVFSKSESILLKIYTKRIHPFIFKFLSPTIFFKKGFIGRDLSGLSISIDYFTVNIVDMLRFLYVYDNINFDIDVCLERNALLKVIDDAINLIEKNSYILKYIFNDDVQIAWYIEMHILYANYSSKYKHLTDKIKLSDKYLHENLMIN